MALFPPYCPASLACPLTITTGRRLKQEVLRFEKVCFYVRGPTPPPKLPVPPLLVKSMRLRLTATELPILAVIQSRNGCSREAEAAQMDRRRERSRNIVWNGLDRTRVSLYTSKTKRFSFPERKLLHYSFFQRDDPNDDR